MRNILRSVMVRISLPIYLVYFVEGASLMLSGDPVDITCGYNFHLSIGTGFIIPPTTEARHRMKQVSTRRVEFCYLLTGRIKRTLFFLFLFSFIKPEARGTDSVCPVQPFFIFVVPGRRWTGSTHCVEKEWCCYTKQHECKIPAHHYWGRKQYKLQLRGGRPWWVGQEKHQSYCRK